MDYPFAEQCTDHGGRVENYFAEPDAALRLLALYATPFRPLVAHGMASSSTGATTAPTAELRPSEVDRGRTSSGELRTCASTRVRQSTAAEGEIGDLDGTDF